MSEYLNIHQMYVTVSFYYFYEVTSGSVLSATWYFLQFRQGKLSDSVKLQSTYTVIIITVIFSSLISDHADSSRVDIFYCLSNISNRDCFSFADEQWNFIQGNFYIVMTFSKNFLRDGSIRQEFYEHHFFWQIYIAAFGILCINRCDHDFVSKEKLVFYLSCESIVCVIKCQRAEHHIIV